MLLAGFLFALFFIIEFLFEWYRLEQPAMEAVSWAEKNNAKLVDLLSPMARAYNNVLAMLVATIGLAIPLTANMHTPKLIEMFLRDRINQIMLFGFAFGAANVLFVAYMVGPDFAPMWAVRFAVVFALLGWVLVIPYFFYVVRFLDPSNILRRLKEEISATVDAGTQGEDVEQCQDVIHERLQQIGTIVLKSTDRADRSVVLDGIWGLKQVMDHYGAMKSKLPDGWFKVDRKDFVGLSAEAIEIINEDRIWFEHKVMHQLYLAYQGALPKSADAVSAISDATRVIASKIADRGDERALTLTVRYFNNYLREAIKRKDIHAIYDLFYQYRLLGLDAGGKHPELLRQIARYFRVYSDVAVGSGLPFVPQIAAFDLAWLVRHAYDEQREAAPDALAEELAMEHMAAGKPVALVVKAKLALGGYFMGKNLEQEARRVRENLANVPADALASIGESLMQVKDRCFWEVTDRQINFEWMPQERRDKVKTFLDSMQSQA